MALGKEHAPTKYNYHASGQTCDNIATRNLLEMMDKSNPLPPVQKISILNQWYLEQNNVKINENQLPGVYMQMSGERTLHGLCT